MRRACEKEQPLAGTAGHRPIRRHTAMQVRRPLDGGHEPGHLLEFVEHDSLIAEGPDEPVRVADSRRPYGGIVERQVAHAQFRGDPADQGGLAGLPAGP